MIVNLHYLLRRCHLALRKLGDVKEPLKLVGKLHKDAKVGDLRNLAHDVGAQLVLVGYPGVPRIFLELLDAKSDALAFLIDLKNQRLDRVPFLDHFTGVNHLTRPGHVRDVEQAVDAILDFDESSVVRQVPHLSADLSADGVFPLDLRPGVHADLLHAEGDFLLLLLDLEHDDLDLVADRDDLVRMTDPLGPGHLGDMNETFDAILQLDEGAVGQHVHHLACDPGTDGVLGLNVGPGALLLLLETQRDAFLLLVNLEHLHLEFLIDFEELRGMVDAAPAHVGDVEKAIDTAQVDKGTKVRDVLHDALADLANLDIGQQFLLLGIPLLFEQAATGDDDVHARLIDLDDLALELLPDVLDDVSTAADPDLRSRQEHGHTDLEEKPPLDLACHAPLDDVTLLVRLDDAFPPADTVRLPLRERNQSAFIFYSLEENLDLVALLERVAVVELIERNNAFGLVANVDDDIGVQDLDDRPHEDLIDLELLDGLVVLGLQVVSDGLEGLVHLSLQLLVGNIKLPDEWIRRHASKSFPTHLRTDPVPG